MSVVLSVAQKPWIGFEAKRLRQALFLTQHELANIAEHGLPVRLDVKLKILKEVWVRKARIKINRDPKFIQ